MNSRETGSAAEQAAGYFLQEKGYRIIQYNYRCRAGEIDIVAEDGDTLVFCEVKYRRTGRYGTPLEAVGSRKQQTIARCAQCFLLEHHVADKRCRFDVIGVTPGHIEHITDAFYC